MPVKVKTSYYENFRMPQECVACGAQPGYGMVWKVAGSKSNWSGKQTTTLTLEFPLCPECHAVSQKKAGAAWVTVLAILGVIGLCIAISAFGASELAEGFPYFGILALIVLVAWIVLMVLWVRSINTKGFTNEQKLRRKNVKKCARIQSFKAPSVFDKFGSIVFIFENHDFARQFALFNQGDIKI